MQQSMKQSSTSTSTTSAEALDTTAVTYPKTYNPILETPVVPSMSSYKMDKGNGKQETRYKISLTLPESEIAPYLQLPALQTQWSELSVNGDAETFQKELDDGKQSMSMFAGIPRPRIAKALPNLASEQETAIAMLQKYHEDMVRFAFHNLPEKGAGSCPHVGKAYRQAKKECGDAGTAAVKTRAEEIYVAGSHCGGLVEKDIQEGDETVTRTLVVVKRKVTTYQNGVKGRYPPVFHQVNAVGEYHAVEVDDYLPKTTLAQVRARPQYFTAPLMYGTTLSFDRDVLLMWRPKKQLRQRQSAVIPYFSDGDEEPAAKKMRME